MEIRDYILELLRHRYEADFVVTVAAKVMDGGDGVAILYSIATDNALRLPKSQKNQVMFRAAYTLDYIYFKYPHLFEPFRERFYSNFALCQNPGAPSSQVVAFGVLNTLCSKMGFSASSLGISVARLTTRHIRMF